MFTVVTLRSLSLRLLSHTHDSIVIVYISVHCMNLMTWLSPQFHIQYMCIYRRHIWFTPSVYEAEDSVLRLVHDNISYRNVPLCIINPRSQSSLQMPKHTISYALCICTCIVYETEDSSKSSDSYTACYMPSVCTVYRDVWNCGLKSPQIPIRRYV